MPQAQRKVGLQIDEDMEFERRSWRWQRVGWGVMALVLLAALLGLFGSGYLDRAQVGAEGSQLWMDYNRFGRLEAETTELRVHFKSSTSTDGKARLWLSREYMEGVKIMNLNPPPVSVEAGAERYTYVFSVSVEGQQSDVIFHLEPEKMGRLQGQVGLDGGPSLNFAQFVYP
jgi:hypothetical protein